jgi:methylmalonyl-CoA/ethylmalonyl-CoA epimerase
VTDGLLPARALDHVGIAVSGRVAPLAALLGDHPRNLVHMPSGVVVARFGPEERLELVAAGRPGSPIERFLERRGAGLHHVALQVDEPLGDLVPRLEAADVELAGAVEPSSDGRPSLFVHPSSTGGVLVELVEGPRRA